MNIVSVIVLTLLVVFVDSFASVCYCVTMKMPGMETRDVTASSGYYSLSARSSVTSSYDIYSETSRELFKVLTPAHFTVSILVSK